MWSYSYINNTRRKVKFPCPGNVYIVPYSVKLSWWRSLLNRQKFPHQNFAITKFRYCMFYSYNLLTSVCHVMSAMESGVLRPITHVGRTLVKTRIHLKEMGLVYRRLYHRHRDQLLAVTLMCPVCWNKLNVLLLWIVIRIATKLRNSSTEIWNLKLLNLCEHVSYNPIIIQCKQKPNSIRQGFARQTFWHASFVKFRQTFPPSKFYAIRYRADFPVHLIYCYLKVQEIWNYTVHFLDKEISHFSNASFLVCRNSITCISHKTCTFLQRLLYSRASWSTSSSIIQWLFY